VIARLSLWRWKFKLGSSVAAGSPALRPGTQGSRAVVVGTVASGSNLFALGADGTQIWSATLAKDIVGDVAVGQTGTVYASTDAGCNSGSACTAVNAVAPPAGATGTPVTCQANGTWGASPAVAANGSADLLYAVALSRGSGANNVYSFSPGATCTSSSGATVTPVTDDVTGVTLGPGAVFASNSHGFTSLDQSGTGFGTQVEYDAGNSGFITNAAPALSADSSRGGAIFGTAGGDQKLRRTVRQSSGCGLGGLSACWATASGFTAAAAGSNLPFTPVFDGTTIWTIDDQGVVYTWTQQNGASVASLDLTEPASPPVLLQGGSALVVTTSGLVKLLSLTGSTLSALKLIDFGAAFSGRVPAPVIDCRATTCSGSGVAYVPAQPAGWVYALQLPAAPISASSTVWPRPGHDSCNTRNASESWCP